MWWLVVTGGTEWDGVAKRGCGCCQMLDGSGIVMSLSCVIMSPCGLGCYTRGWLIRLVYRLDCCDPDRYGVILNL